MCVCTCAGAYVLGIDMRVHMYTLMRVYRANTYMHMFTITHMCAYMWPSGRPSESSMPTGCGDDYRSLA